MNKLWLIGFVVSCVIGWVIMSKYNPYPEAKDLVRKDGMILHPTYGSYPEETNFKQGMTLMPGQSTKATIGINLNHD